MMNPSLPTSALRGLRIRGRCHTFPRTARPSVKQSGASIEAGDVATASRPQRPSAVGKCRVELSRENIREANLVTIDSRRHMRVSRSEQGAITDFVINGRHLSWEELRDRVCPSDHVRADDVIANAIALGRVRIDLNARIHRGTIVTPVDRARARRPNWSMVW